MKATIEQLKDLLDERIVVLDGSYGVLIQKTVKGEEAYRGDRFRREPRHRSGRRASRRGRSGDRWRNRGSFRTAR